MSWFPKWLFRSYFLLLTTQAGVPLTLLALFGYSSLLDDFFRKNRPLTVIVLFIHFMWYLIAEMAKDEERRLAELRKQLDDA